ncbi:hypothetical protein C8A03DRAFT_40787 [Achaetomium macrosporum]|uniref:Uncharacterized protein n=1 Tax=Achaetomium macrosporum TaxID=79813 RepID=A0AAN7CGT5_9PEZI|nr:hypothetical protein C8A03DRAFT_40787 [Achaetomium macrosporum]
METQTRSRLELRPVWTGREQHAGYARPSPYSATSPLYSASLSVPSPMYPPSPGYDQAMRAHERALVDRLDHRGRRESQESLATARSLSPISEQIQRARRASVASLPQPRSAAPSPRSPRRMQFARRPTIEAETRSILLSGMPDGLPCPPAETSSAITDRRQSLPSSFHSSRRSSQQLRQDLLDWGRVYLGNARVADCFVAAAALRRPSDSSSADEAAAAKDKPFEGRNRVTIRARVRPCALDRKPFLLRRTFDMDELRATIPEPSPVTAGAAPPAAESNSQSPVLTSQRRSSMAAGIEHGLDLGRSPLQTTNTVPIHLKYARAFLPVLAALLYSGHIKTGDIINLPLPYPEAWVQTVAYVYTGQGELTEAMKQNILYLGGKV